MNKKRGASCITTHLLPASGCRFHTSSSFFQRRDRKRKGRKSPALPSRYGLDNYQILLLVLQFPCLWRNRFRQDQIHRQTLMEQYIRSGFAGFIYFPYFFVFLSKERQKAERAEKPCSPFTLRTGQLSDIITGSPISLSMEEPVPARPNP